MGTTLVHRTKHFVFAAKKHVMLVARNILRSLRCVKYGDRRHLHTTHPTYTGGKKNLRTLYDTFGIAWAPTCHADLTTCGRTVFGTQNPFLACRESRTVCLRKRSAPAAFPHLTPAERKAASGSVCGVRVRGVSNAFDTPLIMHQLFPLNPQFVPKLGLRSRLEIDLLFAA